MTHQEHDREPQPADYAEGSELLDWLYIALATGIIAGIILAAVYGHYLVSIGVQP